MLKVLSPYNIEAQRYVVIEQKSIAMQYSLTLSWFKF